MKREDFVKEFIESLKNNKNIVSRKDTAEGAYESLQFSYPRVEDKGIACLLKELTDCLLQENNQSIKSIFPSYFILNREFIDGLEYCINSKIYTPEAHQNLVDLLFSVYILIPFTILKCHAKPYEIHELLTNIDPTIHDGYKLLSELLKHINDGLITKVSESYANQIHMHTLFSDFISLLLSLPLSNPIASIWSELFFFIRDYILLHPSSIQESTSFIIALLHHYNTNVPIQNTSYTPRFEWLDDINYILLSIANQCCHSYELLTNTSTSIMIHLCTLHYECICSLFQWIQQQLIDCLSYLSSHPTTYESSSVYQIILYYLQIIDFYAEYVPLKDPFVSLSSIGISNFVYHIISSFPPSSGICQTTKHIVLILCLRNNKAYSYFTQIPLVTSLLMEMNNKENEEKHSFHASFWRILLSKATVDQEMHVVSLMLQQPSSVTYLTNTSDILAAMDTSKLIQDLKEEKKKEFAAFFGLLRNKIQDIVDGVIKEEKEFEATSTGEEIKERNFELEKELCLHIITKVKKINVMLVYGRNKCD